jgi:hypothetical protein
MQQGLFRPDKRSRAAAIQVSHVAGYARGSIPNVLQIRVDRREWEIMESDTGRYDDD